MAWAAAATAISTAISTGVSLHQSEQQKRIAKRQATRQREAQNRQQGLALNQQRLEQERIRRQRARKPNVAAMLSDIQAQNSGLGGNLLTGASGVPRNQLKLGGTDLLGT